MLCKCLTLKQRTCARAGDNGFFFRIRNHDRVGPRLTDYPGILSFTVDVKAVAAMLIVGNGMPNREVAYNFGNEGCFS